jgi:hypothetical protein
MTPARVLPLKGGCNFRDCGGYETTDGGRVRWGRLYRSGLMTRLSPAAAAQVQALGVRAVCDLRRTAERALHPNPSFGAAVRRFEWDSVAFKAGVAPGMIIVAVNGKAYTHGRLQEALKAAKADPKLPTELLVRSADTFSTVNLDYHGGLRYPYLERIEKTPDRLSSILQPRLPSPAVKK